MQIRRANLNDAQKIAKVHVDTWNTSYKGIVPDEYLKQMSYSSRESMWRDILFQQAVFVAEMNEKVIGFANGGKERTGNYPGYDGELYAIYILEEFQQLGIGKLLFASVVEYLIHMNVMSLMVSVLQDNPSRLFYECLGASHVDTVEVDVAGKKITELIYGWKDITEII